MNISVLLSGSGRTLENLLRHFKITNVISSRSDVRGVTIARAHKVPVVTTKDSDAIFSILDETSIDLVCLAGWVHLLDIPKRYTNKVINIHPSLLPMFGGKGMYGNNVHDAVIKHGCKVSGCTVHFVDNEYDSGPIIVQRTVPVMEEDRLGDLAARVFRAECEAYPEAVRLFLDGKLEISGRRVRVRQ